MERSVLAEPQLQSKRNMKQTPNWAFGVCCVCFFFSFSFFYPSNAPFLQDSTAPLLPPMPGVTQLGKGAEAASCSAFP